MNVHGIPVHEAFIHVGGAIVFVALVWFAIISPGFRVFLLTSAGVAAFMFFVLVSRAPALEISPDPYKPVQWYPPEPPPPGTYMPMPMPPRQDRPDYYREWERWRGPPVQQGPYAPPGGFPCGYRDVYGRVVPCR